jgi:transcriptional regulator with XRE-family HTH domain
MAGRKLIAHLESEAELGDNGGGRANPIDALIGSRIRMRRINLGYSAKLLSEALGVTVEQLTRWESGANRVGARQLKEISEILQASPSAFFEDPESHPMGASANHASREWGEPSNAASAAESLELFWAFSRIADPAVRRKLLAFAVALASDRLTRN